ncbi:hypothetical protein [Actinomadura sp. 3N407]|uniref:hypothetical protein n=1 Tax=Actinomadura sp. 3N407 TaxID=3457423 RepID=UPI003FCDEF71
MIDSGAVAVAGPTPEHAAAFVTNNASHAVSRKLGYRPDGVDRRVVRGMMVPDGRLRLSRADWDHHRTVTIEGRTPCLPLLGLSST